MRPVHTHLGRNLTLTTLTYRVSKVVLLGKKFIPYILRFCACEIIKERITKKRSFMSQPLRARKLNIRKIGYDGNITSFQNYLG